MGEGVRGTQPGMPVQCCDCGRRIAATGPVFSIDATMTKFRCASCQLAARVKLLAVTR